MDLEVKKKNHFYPSHWQSFFCGEWEPILCLNNPNFTTKYLQQKQGFLAEKKVKFNITTSSSSYNDLFCQEMPRNDRQKFQAVLSFASMK